MTARVWKPGDVAIAEFNGDVGVAVSRYERGWVRLTDPDDYINDDVPYSDGQPRIVDIRPVVVIDPEDSAQVQRLIGFLGADFYYGDAGALAASLREFVSRTPLVDEPTGLGAVVEDDEGRTWIRVNGKPGYEWYLPNQCIRPWSDFNAVRVLSEGMS